jgi:LPS sulfotransferase NodH
VSRFVIIAAPRTGSNLLCTLLNSHPEVLCHHELFNPQGIYTALTLRDRPPALGTIEDRDRDPLAFLARAWQTGAGFGCIGFKWTRGQNETVLRAVVEDPDVKKIVLRRRNRIKTFISEKIAQQTQQWEVYDEHDLSRPRPRVSVDDTELLNHISANDRFYDDLGSLLDRTDQPRVDVCYESVFSPAEQSRLLQFLGVKDTLRPLVAASVKQNPTDLRELIANFGELTASLEDWDLRAELFDRDM